MAQQPIISNNNSQSYLLLSSYPVCDILYITAKQRCSVYHRD